jgi:hypothetical protein
MIDEANFLLTTMELPEGPIRSDGPFPAYDEIYTIVPGMKPALLEAVPASGVVNFR